MYKNCNIALKFVVYFLIFEVVLGGAGRVITIGPLSIRMLLYIIGFLLTAICLMTNKTKNYKENFRNMSVFYKIIGAFMFLVCFSAVNGYFVAHHNLSQVVSDVTGYVSFLLIIIFNLAINGKKQIKNMSIAFVIASVVQAAIIVIIHYGLALHFFQFDGMNALLQNLYIGNLAYIVPDAIRIFFRSSMYLPIAFILLVGISSREEFKKYEKMIFASLILVTYAILLSFTRGFWIALVISLVLYIALKQVKNLKRVILVLLLGTAFMLGMSYMAIGNNNTFLSIITRTGLVHQSSVINSKTNKLSIQPGLDGGEDLSLDYRNKLSKSMVTMIKKHPILGNGYGVLLTEIGQTSSRCEYMYLDIWMEMGIVGLVVFAGIFIILFAKWIKIRKNTTNIADIYLLDAIMVSLIGSLINSGLNPFFNNPLGITFTIFAVCAVNVYGKEK